MLFTNLSAVNHFVTNSKSSSHYLVSIRLCRLCFVRLRPPSTKLLIPDNNLKIHDI